MTGRRWSISNVDRTHSILTINLFVDAIDDRHVWQRTTRYLPRNYGQRGINNSRGRFNEYKAAL